MLVSMPDKLPDLDWHRALPATITPQQFRRLATARNAQLESDALDDTSSAHRLARPQGSGEQDESSEADYLSTVCNHDVAAMLQALRKIPKVPSASWGWLGTDDHRTKAAARVAAQQEEAQQEARVQTQVASAEHDRVSGSGQARDNIFLGKTAAKVIRACDPKDMMRQAMEKRREQDRKLAECKLREQGRAAIRAKVCTCSCLPATSSCLRHRIVSLVPMPQSVGPCCRRGKHNKKR